MSNQPIAQWNCTIYFHTRDSFLTTSCNSQFSEKNAQFERNCKSARFVCFDSWLLRYDHISSNKVFCYFVIERVRFIHRLLILFIRMFSFLLLFTVSWRYKKDHLNAGIDILLYIMFYIINTMKKHQTRLYLQYKKVTI